MASPLRTSDPERLGSYRITGRLGRGGMGTVYLGEDERGRQVAVKVINAELADEEAFRARFRREVTAARQVRRFCTAAVLDARLDGEPLYVVTEFVDGPGLDQAVAERGPMYGGNLEGLAVGIATALSAIHGAGIVHRDLKPSNVMLSSTGPRVIDFGIARALDAVDGPTRTGQFVGTPSYIAPEILRGGEITPAADVFSWGCVVAYAGTGRAPFAGNTVPEIIHRVISDPPVLDGLDPALLPLVSRALAKDPAQRPSHNELLTSLTGHAPASVPPQPPTVATPLTTSSTREDSAPPSRRVPGARKVGAIAAAVVAVLLVGVLGWTMFGPADGPPEPGTAIVLKDNFESTGSGWPNQSYDCGGYDTKLKVYSIGVKFTGDNRKTCATPGLRVSPTKRYLHDLKVKLFGGPANGQWDAGTWVLGKDKKWYDVVFRPDGTVRLVKWGADRGSELKSAKVEGFKSTGFNRLQVEVDLRGKGTKIKVWANGSAAIDHTDTDTPLREGDTGLVVNRPWNSAGTSEAWAQFDDYALSEIPE
ncbi:serine/threonine-protein kinase [Spirillospora sp. CA-294931]|uniref:serine/threonine-protein kinase n=1 Tax=Spirillospora sp. CA-294931 TaxID=3240042 RepID=UPI003D92A60F